MCVCVRERENERVRGRYGLHNFGYGCHQATAHRQAFGHVEEVFGHVQASQVATHKLVSHTVAN